MTNGTPNPISTPSWSGLGINPLNLTQIYQSMQAIVQAINSLQKTIATGFPTWLTSSATWSPGSISAGAQAVTSVSCSGAALGEPAQASFSENLGGLTFTAYVSAAGEVEVVAFNGTTGAVNPGSGTVKVFVLSAT